MRAVEGEERLHAEAPRRGLAQRAADERAQALLRMERQRLRVRAVCGERAAGAPPRAAEAVGAGEVEEAAEAQAVEGRADGRGVAAEAVGVDDVVEGFAEVARCEQPLRCTAHSAQRGR